MDNITSGYTTIQNISKFWDYVIPALLFVLAGIGARFVDKRNEIQSNQASSSVILKGLPLGLSFAYILYVLGASANVSEFVLSLSSLAIAAALAYILIRMESAVVLPVQLCVALCALNLKIFTTQGNFFILLVLNFVACLLIYQKKFDFLVAIVSIIIFKKFDFGPYVVKDLFHSSEFVISYQRGLNAMGEWNVFPNIGYLEEAIPNFMVDVISAGSFGVVQLSIQDAYSLCLIFLTGCMYYFLEKKWKGVAYALTMVLVIERLTLMLVVNLGLILSALRSNYLTWALIGLIPLLMLGLSPSYGAILVLSCALFFMRSKPSMNLLASTVFVAAICIVLYNDTLIYFLKVYKDWGGVNNAAHGTSLWAAPAFKTVLRLAFVFALSLLIWQVIRDDVQDIYGYIALFGVGLSLWMYLSYGFTRLDKGTGSRIFPVGLAILICLIPYIRRYTKVIPPILFVSFFGASFATPQPLGKMDLFRQSSKMTLNAESQEVLARYESVVQKLDSNVIVFGKHPTLVNYMPQVKVPPFSSPWVAIGQFPQEQVVGFFKNNSNTPILLGDDFSTWDSVDVRARSPLIYRYLAEQYSQVRINGVIVAMPLSDAKSSQFFSGFDIGAAGAYYEKSKNPVNVVVSCDKGDAAADMYKVSNEKNYFYAKLKCGLNSIPDVYFLGSYLNVSPRQVD